MSGALIIETNLTDSITQNTLIAALVFLMTFVGATLLTKRENRRMSLVLDGINAKARLNQVEAAAKAHEVYLLSHDPLTGLANRSLFQDRLDAENPTQRCNDLVVGIIDLDDFKSVNDAHGHNAGDALLQEVANRLSAIIPSDCGLLARLGGDEFAVVMQFNDHFSDAAIIGDAFLAALKPVMIFEGNEIRPRCSIGLAVAPKDSVIAPVELMRCADAALYQAKSDGKRAYRVFDDEIQQQLLRRSEISAQLPIAIGAGEIRAVLQPKMHLETGRLYGFEALARWRHGDENIGPNEFVPVAEDTGVVRELDFFIMRQAAEFTVSVLNETGIEVPVSTNLSALNFRTTDLAQQILTVLETTKLPPHLLTVEVTETTAVENWDCLVETLKDLQSFGVRTSLDDFGTGYSSLSYLRRFAFQEIKIDRSFIVNIQNDEETRFLFESICALADGLGSAVVVEGIETHDQADLCAANGAQYGQGFFFSKPLELADARDLISSEQAKPANMQSFGGR